MPVVTPASGTATLRARRRIFCDVAHDPPPRHDEATTMKSIQHVLWRGALALSLMAVGIGSGIGMPPAAARRRRGPTSASGVPPEASRAAQVLVCRGPLDRRRARPGTPCSPTALVVTARSDGAATIVGRSSTGSRNARRSPHAYGECSERRAAAPPSANRVPCRPADHATSPAGAQRAATLATSPRPMRAATARREQQHQPAVGGYGTCALGAWLQVRRCARPAQPEQPMPAPPARAAVKRQRIRPPSAGAQPGTGAAAAGRARRSSSHAFAPTIQPMARWRRAVPSR